MGTAFDNIRSFATRTTKRALGKPGGGIVGAFVVFALACCSYLLNVSNLSRVRNVAAVAVVEVETRSNDGHVRSRGASTPPLFQYRADNVAVTTVARNNDHDVTSRRRNDVLDFFIIGFPKCGTTTLLYSFKTHNETVIMPREYCQINVGGSDEDAVGDLAAALDNLSTSRNVKRGIKCPNSVRFVKGINRINKKSFDTRLIIGVRNPILFFQSYYNYRISEMYNKNKIVKVPPPETLIGSRSWKHVSTDLARFELSLMQLGKVSLSTRDLKRMASKKLEVAPTPFKVFIYSVEQLDDDNEKRAERFRAEMQDFLGLIDPIPPFSHENINRNTKHTEHMNICDERYGDLRKLLSSQGNVTQRWIREKFIESKDVFVGGQTYFNQLIQKWGDDPCQASRET
eukprot:CAMPEP_0172512836 /NCGR_PEP_ID=MMETSP1066-20121228/247604_1 /TAXON_ID=671091 /ORGANISM="Coscinodiscus wailesii, Strain CCMP2513" /LENGTH=399 /DNA_ID=CAMNT_0013292813 /DNA_START=274 /DNA_END=1473 /DNA_ORIENTATION=+